ncbi:Polyubiquitin [Rhynchospora pubera]|uniref:Polyubiquitin n=1 Tax=Rhynchospora pubera TaxID=906938 RepID=A0AAV8E2Y3_9POAL|nr:Polyubiquitin [Rhynchospora pubera]
MQILVKTITGRTVTVEVDSPEQIEYVKVCVESLMRVFVKTNAGKILALETEKGHTISNLKAMIEKMEGIPQTDQQLFLDQKKLEDADTLTDCGIVRDSTIQLVLNKRNEKMKICIEPHCFQGKIFWLEVEASDLIEDVKSRIVGIYGIPAWQQKLLFGAKLLENRRTLAEYNVKNGSIINLVRISADKNRCSVF